MGKLIYIILLEFTLLSMFACRKENINPCNLTSDVWAPCKESCTQYFYKNKYNEKISLGEARESNILVGFADYLSIDDKQQLLAPYSAFESIESETYSDSGVITNVQLKSGTTCFEVEKMIRKLEKQSAVLFATPTFDDPDGIALWIGLSNEFIVTLEDEATKAQLEALASKTKTTIIMLLFDQTYILSADKNSNGNALEMSTYFVKQAFIAIAEPNFIFKLAPSDLETLSARERAKKDIY